MERKDVTEFIEFTGGREVERAGVARNSSES